MPKVSSSTASRRAARDEEKENSAPTMASYNRRAAKHYDDEPKDTIVGLGKPSHSSRSAKERNVSSSSGSEHFAKGGSSSKRAMDDVYPESKTRSSKPSGSHRSTVHRAATADIDHEDVVLPLRSLKKEDVLRELEEVQVQFDDLREARITEPERLLAEWRTMAEHKSRLAEEYIASLTKQIDELRHEKPRSRPAVHKGHSLDDDSAEHDKDQVYELRRQLEANRRREDKLKAENEKLAQDLRKCRMQIGSSTSSMAFRAGIGSGQMPHSNDDEQAVRRLYEDLTGIVINKIEHAEDGQHDARRFHAIFACAGYHDLEIKFDESTSELPATVPGTNAGLREDLVYTPTFDEDRDADLLASGQFPSYLKDPIRFERATAVKFLSTLHKRLDRHSKR